MRDSDAVARLRSQLSDKELDLIEMQQSYERLMRMTEETRDLLKQTHEEKDEYRKHEAIAEQLKIRNDTLQLKIDELSEQLKGRSFAERKSSFGCGEHFSTSVEGKFKGERVERRQRQS